MTNFVFNIDFIDNKIQNSYYFNKLYKIYTYNFSPKIYKYLIDKNLKNNNKVNKKLEVDNILKDYTIDYKEIFLIEYYKNISYNEFYNIVIFTFSFFNYLFFRNLRNKTIKRRLFIFLDNNRYLFNNTTNFKLNVYATLMFLTCFISMYSLIKIFVALANKHVFINSEEIEVLAKINNKQL